VTLVLGLAAVLTEPNGPLGAFWTQAPWVPQAIGVRAPLFMLLGVFEALFFLGVAFLLFSY
jgi:hypothetical protein